MLGRRLSFWLAVAGVSVIANTAIEVASARWPNRGLSQFVAFTHRGAS